jgi:two-component system NtrC family sensor kinase
VVVDQHLPGMQGTEFCRAMRANSATNTIPILILTGDTESEVERQGLESGADDYVAKSSDRDVLLARVELLLRRAAARTPEGAHDFFRAQQILAVDDSPTYRALIEEELRREGYGVTVVPDGAAALEAIAAGRIDCAVVDLVMPGMDGIELCRRISEHRGPGKAELPILIVTSHASKEKMMEALDAGADDFVEKSSDSTVLKARIRALLRRKMLHEEQARIQSALRDQQVELARERAERKAAQARADLAERLEAANRELEVANRELRDAHVQLVQSAKMASLGALVAGIAHEVNNPLAFSISHLGTIAGALDVVVAEAGGLSEEGKAKLDKARQRAGDVAEGLARVRDLVTKLRTFSRLDEGSFKTADIRECIESALAFIGHRLGRGVSVRTAYAEDNTLYCAPGLLNQVVLNLLTNAVDAVGESGQVTVATGRDAGTFRLTVSDSGPGVPDALRERIFEPFFTTKEVGAGTGMGLAISYRIVERHRGRIEVGRSAEGGAAFTVHIPLNLAEFADAAA